MARISYLEKDTATKEARLILENLEQKGKILNFHKAMAHSPRAIQTFLDFFSAIIKGKLDPKLRELAYLKTSRLNHCHY